MALTIQAAYVETLTQSRYFFIGSATEGLIQHYVRLGCQEVPLSYEHKLLGGTYHRVFVGDLIAALIGKRSIHPVVWWNFYAPILRTALALDLRCLGPPTRAFFRKRLVQYSDDTLLRLTLDS